MDVEKALEMLGCAEVNCDNIKKIGPVFADIVKTQIQDAIRALDGEIFTDDPVAHLK